MVFNTHINTDTIKNHHTQTHTDIYIYVCVCVLLESSPMLCEAGVQSPDESYQKLTNGS